MRVKLDFERRTCDLLDVDPLELGLLQDALAHYVESLFPEVAVALQEGRSLETALANLDEQDAGRVRTLVERLHDRLERPLLVLEELSDLDEEEEGDTHRVRIVLEREEEARLLHEAAQLLQGKAREPLIEEEDLPRTDVEALVRDFATWFDPDDIPEYPYFIEMAVSDARIMAHLAERAQLAEPHPMLEQLLKVMLAASDVPAPDDEEDDESPDQDEA
ncbi:MAG: hypothetical protein VKP72_11020 [bacterium]|nr:hypothetical protein [bacterium]